MAKYPFDGDAAAEVLHGGVLALDTVVTLMMQGGPDLGDALNPEGLGHLLRFIHERLEEGRARSEAEADQLRELHLRASGMRSVKPIEGL